MNISLPFLRASLVFISILIGSSVSASIASSNELPAYILIGGISGLFFALLLIGLEILVKKTATLRGYNVLTIGLLFGILLGTTIQGLLGVILTSTNFALSPQITAVLHAVIYLASCYFAVILTAQASQELYISIPFLKFKPTTPAKKDLLLDISVLHDPRLIDLAASGLLDNLVLLPNFIVKELQEQCEDNEDDIVRTRARRSLEVIDKLEALPHLNLRYTDVDFHEIKDPITHLARVARHLDCNILTADINRVQQANIEGLRIVNIHSLSNALKPLTQTGEYMGIKIQRYGKEARQGVGYLDDGTMVVVNGGAAFIGDTIRTQVLSVKHTSSGRMIFCNALDVDLDDLSLETASIPALKDGDNSKRYYS
ncbi:MAG: hypothetical protein WC222_09660 [Parachlamydiales bacterium]|jgi:uncharacterized protein YacL